MTVKTHVEVVSKTGLLWCGGRTCGGLHCTVVIVSHMMEYITRWSTYLSSLLCLMLSSVKIIINRVNLL